MLSIYQPNTIPCIAPSSGGIMMQKESDNDYVKCSKDETFATQVLRRDRAERNVSKLLRNSSAAPTTKGHSSSNDGGTHKSSPGSTNSSPGKLDKNTKPKKVATPSASGGAPLTPKSGSKGSKWYQTSRNLGPDFTPGRYDVICARGKSAWNHSGNKYFRGLVKHSIEDYAKAKNKPERTGIVSRIVTTIRTKGTGFVKQEGDDQGNGWIEVGDLLAREKIGQMLRNGLSGRYRSSVRSKKERRRTVEAKRTDSLHDLLRDFNEEIHLSMVTIKEGAFHGNLSDQQLMELFTSEQKNILTQIKSDNELVERFLQAEVTACLVLHDDDTSMDSDGDHKMEDAY